MIGFVPGIECTGSFTGLRLGLGTTFCDRLGFVSLERTAACPLIRDVLAAVGVAVFRREGSGRALGLRGTRAALAVPGIMGAGQVASRDGCT